MADRRFKVTLGPPAPPAVPARLAPPPHDPLLRYDALGRAEPHKLMFGRWLRGMPWMLKHFTHDVPDRLLTRGPEGITIACPCGEVVTLSVGFSWVCDCDRHYFHAGTRVMVSPAPGVD